MAANKHYFENGREAIKAAEHADCTVRHGKGDHVVIEIPGYPNQVVMDRPMGRGIGCKVWKAFRLAGLLVILFMLYSLITAPRMMQALWSDVHANAPTTTESMP